MSTRIVVRLAGGHEVEYIDDETPTQQSIRRVVSLFETAMGEGTVTLDNFDDIAKAAPGDSSKPRATLFNADYITSVTITDSEE